MPALITHGHSIGGKTSPTMNSWRSMKARCMNSNVPDYARYGGRGITVCDEWVNDFGAFLSDMGERPSGCSLDRIDNDGPYTKANCRWADATTQQRNTKASRRLTVNGITKPLIEWSRETGLRYSTLLNRVYAGWADDLIVSQPSRKAS